MKNTLTWTLCLLLAACTSLDRNDMNDTIADENTTAGETAENDRAAPSTNATGYNFSSPDMVFELPLALREVSGLAMIDDTRLACVQDEIGAVFIFNTGKKDIDDKIQFAGKGDFEELALVNDDAYVLESNGNIYYLPAYLGDERVQSELLSTPLGRENDAEGMCYDKKNNRLLISCKGKGETKNKKAIYSFDLKNKEMSTDPVMQLSLKRVKDALAQSSEAKDKDMKKILKADEMDKLFTPSGITIHPLTGELYVLSTQNKLLAVLDMQGNVKQVIELENELFTQPEGIAFSSKGDLYISNEGQKGAGNILMFTYAKN
jgi:uncharacterized protein YjiK